MTIPGDFKNRPGSGSVAELLGWKTSNDNYDLPTRSVDTRKSTMDMMATAAASNDFANALDSPPPVPYATTVTPTPVAIEGSGETQPAAHPGINTEEEDRQMR